MSPHERAAVLLAAVLRDAGAAGVPGSASLETDGHGLLRLRVRTPVSQGGPSEAVPEGSNDAQLLVWLAEGVQEELMERDQADCHVWPTCRTHGFGGHPMVVTGQALWWCRGGSGHALASIGQLAPG